MNPPRSESNARPRPVAWGGGIPSCLEDDIFVLPWNDLAQVEEVLDRRGSEIAAVITEPIMCNQGCIEPEVGFLEGLRSLCDQHGAALVFDEIITGFRLGLSGAQGHYGVTPDLALFGKALGAGFPISALAGTTRFMDPLARGEVYHAGTMNSGNASIAAAGAVLEVLGRNDSEGFRHIWRIGTRLRDEIASLAADFDQDLRVQGPGPMFHVGFSKRARATCYEHVLDYDRELYTECCRGMLARGIRLIERGLWYVSLAHTDADVDQAVNAFAETLSDLRK